ncbi:lyase family protein [Ectobacillus ponti]|uniref:Lyase family protein n=1 Tax=Ectobacillus ponti TaxID=2961894 RepID=A0AA41XF21_9BACI|nr:lyase family protein [Ectobacillus ponti]MCP8970921.1 lyase family protein [Ectobacillus ponti]
MLSSTLYGEQTKRTVNNMSYTGRTLSQYPLYIQALAEVKQAAAMANCEAGAISQEICSAIVAACRSIMAGQHHDQFPVDVYHGGGSIGTNMNMNEVLAALTAVPAAQINLSQSTADVCFTALRIALIRRAQPLLAVLRRCIEALRQKGEEFTGMETISRTCLQDAMRTSHGVLFQACAANLEKHVVQLEERIQDLHQVNLGGTVIGSGTGASQAYRDHILSCLQKVTDMPLRHRSNLYEAAQYPDDLAACSGALRMMSANLLKFAKDLRLLSSGPEAGFAELKLPAVQAGSSFFPGKVNPVIPEMLVQCSLLVSGRDHTIQAALEHGELQLNIWDGMMGMLLYENMEMLTHALQNFYDYCLVGIEVNQERSSLYAASSIPLVVELTEQYGYEQVSGWLQTESVQQVQRKLKEERKHDERNT